MQSNYKPIGDYIQLVDERNKDLNVPTLLGLSISKEFIPSVANTVGTNMRNYKIIRKNQFACSIMQVRRDGKMPVALLEDIEEAIISQAYPVFEIKDTEVLLPQYLMMWFSRSEFDRQATFHAVGGVRGSLEWEDFLAFGIPVPSIDKQREIVREYNVVKNRIKLNEEINQKLEETAQALYKHWFVDFEFPNKEGKPYKSSGGKLVYNDELDKEIPEGWSKGTFQDHVNVKMGQSPKGNTYNYDGYGTPLINGPVEFGVFFTEKRKWTTAPTKTCEKGELIICVRGSTVGRFVKSDGIYCLGRGVCSFRGIQSQRFVDELYKYSLEELLSYTTGSTFPNLDGRTLLSFPSIVPSAILIDLFQQCSDSMLSVVEFKAKENKYLNEIQILLLSRMARIEEPAPFTYE
jgi:type I restriction enzyme S subunit